MKSSLVIALGFAALGAALVAGVVWAQSPQPMQPGQMQHDQMPQGQMPQGHQMQPGQMQQHGQMPQGQMPSGQMPSCQMAQGQMAHGQMPCGQMPQGQMPHGQMSQGGMPHGDMSQGMHQMHQMHHAMQSGQGAFGAMAEVVRTLEADPATDWSKVDIERLRQHLIDMDEVVLRATVKATQVPAGLSMDVTGKGRTAQSIRDMLIPHAAELDAMPAWSAKTEQIPDGVRLVVVARDAGDTKTVARIRGLGFAGLLVQGGHHGPHHLAMAKGEMPASHGH